MLGLWGSWKPELHRKHPKQRAKTRLKIFDLAILSLTLRGRNYLIFGKVMSAVAPFLGSFMKISRAICTGNIYY